MLDKLFNSFSHIVFFDVETSGLDPKRDEIIELGALRLSADSEVELNRLIKLSEGRSLPARITELTGITDELLLAEGVEKAVAAADFAELIRCPDTLVVAYNAQFDLNFIYQLLRAEGRAGALRGVKMLDALTVYRDRRDYPHKLIDAINAYSLDAQNSHRAVDDARAACLLLEAMESERDDIENYINLFGYHPKYGVSGSRIASVRYLPQPYERVKPLYEYGGNE